VVDILELVEGMGSLRVVAGIQDSEGTGMDLHSQIRKT